MKEILKKNILSIICGVVAIAAIVASFIPLGSYTEELEGKLQASNSNRSQLRELATKQRMKPIVSADASGAEPLDTFPSEEVANKGREITEQVEQESLRMRQVAEEMNKHALLVPGSLPTPTTTAQIAYRVEYTRLFTPPELGVLPPVVASTNGRPPLNAATPPSEAKIQQAAAEEELKIRSENESRVGGSVTNAAEVAEMIAEMKRKLPETMRKDVANGALVYVDPMALTMNQKLASLTAGARPDPVDIWWSQVQLWVQQDVLNAIAEMNAGKANVIEAPVKHLISVLVPPMFITGVAAAGAEAAAPAAGGSSDAAVPKNPAVSMTGRVSNPLYDVIHFDLVVDVEVDQIPHFLRKLGDKRFITVREFNVAAVDSAGELAKGYYYGTKPVGHLTLKCEAILMRKWTAPLMPPLVKQLLGVTEEPVDATATPTAMVQ